MYQGLFVLSHLRTFAHISKITQPVTEETLFYARSVAEYGCSIPKEHRIEAAQLAREALTRLVGADTRRATRVRNYVKTFVAKVEGTLDSDLIKGNGRDAVQLPQAASPTRLPPAFDRRGGRRSSF